MSEIATFGETMLRLSPERGERLETAESLNSRTAGAESNVAITASRLGADATWISKLPDTALGRRVSGDVRRHGVTPAITWSDEGRQGTYYIEQAGEPRGTNVIYDRANATVTTAETGEIATGAIENANVFFTTGITPALSDTLYETTLELLQTETTTGFDLNYRSKLWSEEAAAEAYDELIPKVDLLFAPERDARSILGLNGNVESIAKTLRSQYDCEAVVITRGSEGALAVTNSEMVVQPAFETDTIDPIGTGDAFVGAFLSRYVRKASTERALEYGAATAALKRTIEGDTAVVTESEVDRVITKRGESISR